MYRLFTFQGHIRRMHDGRLAKKVFFHRSFHWWRTLQAVMPPTGAHDARHKGVGRARCRIELPLEVAFQKWTQRPSFARVVGRMQVQGMQRPQFLYDITGDRELWRAFSRRVAPVKW